jgi:hypothetical protein
MPVRVIDIIKPNGIPIGQNQFPTVEDIDFLGGFQVQPFYGSVMGFGILDGYAQPYTVINSVNTPIPAENRKEGMLVYVISDTSYFQLANDLLTWNVASFGSGSLNGDVTGPSTSNTITAIQGVPLETISLPPTQGSVLVYDTSDSMYDIRPLTADDILPGFTITSFAGGSTVEAGNTVTNPSFTASYSSLPSSAHITNTDGYDSPLFLTTPYTSGIVTGSFTHSTITYVTFTLTAIASSTQNAFQYIYFAGRDFGGVGAAGATSSVTASGSSAVLSTSDVLADQGLFFGSENVGIAFGPFNPSSQKIYLLLQGGAHTFKDQNGFTFPMTGGSPTTVSFTNQYGAVITMYLYESQNLLSTSFTLTIAS